MVTGSSEIITITLDGLAVSGPPGTTILELARESGVVIPTLCSDPILAPVGACRICLVEDERNGNLYASCVTPISPGMAINTKTDTVLEHRKNIVELMLTSHPDTCMVCDKGNRCQLRQIAADMGIGFSKLYRTPHSSIIQELNPYIERDLTKCIMCSKCIRACQERVVEGAIDYYQRGFTARPATFNDLPLEFSECTFCGTCIPLCPTGALSEKLKDYRGSTATSKETICPFCACGCLLDIETKDNSIVRVKPGRGKSINNGTACIWGSYSLDFIHSRDRLTKPLIKKEGSFKESSWEEALEFAVKRFSEIIKKNGPDSFATTISPNCTNEDDYALQRFARAVIGTNNIDSFSYYTPFDSDVRNSLPPGNLCHIEDIENADLIILIGADPENSTPIVSYAIKRAVRFKKVKLLILYPLETKLSKFSDISLYPMVGAETTVLNGIARQIISNAGDDVKSIGSRIINLQAFINFLNDYSLNTASKKTGLSSEQIASASKLLAGSNNPIVIYDSANVQCSNSSELTRATENIILLLNCLNKKGCGYINLHHYCNSLGATDMGISPDYLPGYQSITDTDIRNKFNAVWDTILPDVKGKHIIELLSGSDGKTPNLKCFYIVGENPVRDLPSDMNIDLLFSSLDFILVQDMFLTETAKLADVVLPVASFAEKEGSFTNLEGRIQKLNKVFNPPGESLPDWEIFVKLSRKFSKNLPYKFVKEIAAEIDALVPLYQGIKDITKTKNLSLDTNNIRNSYPITEDKEPAAFIITRYENEKESDSDYPFHLIRATNSGYFGTGTRTSRATRFVDRIPKEFTAEINLEAAKAFSLCEEDYVNLISQSSKLPARVHLNDRIPDRVIFVMDIPVSYDRMQGNLLTLQNNGLNKKEPVIQNAKFKLVKVIEDVR